MTPEYRGSWFVISSVIYARQALGDQIEFIYGDMGQCLSDSHAQQGPIITVFPHKSNIVICLTKYVLPSLMWK